MKIKKHWPRSFCKDSTLLPWCHPAGVNASFLRFLKTGCIFFQRPYQEPWILSVWFSVSVRTLQAYWGHICIHWLLLIQYLLCDKQLLEESEFLGEEDLVAAHNGGYSLAVAGEVQAENNYNIISFGETRNRALLETKDISGRQLLVEVMIKWMSRWVSEWINHSVPFPLKVSKMSSLHRWGSGAWGRWRVSISHLAHDCSIRSFSLLCSKYVEPWECPYLILSLSLEKKSSAFQIFWCTRYERGTLVSKTVLLVGIRHTQGKRPTVWW